ncbi:MULTISPECIES: GDSL-type esterase/lipase family protein [Catenuloplanes]|uniref:Lysophospholipase L1-like esterase n=1 Tax=Catenuloplanes niger TaxID=587534 RepID=A0AAE3ZV02_9ACTN|nr:GDSL-type esterase/lipase family protein [Catenuloplanes niger]MDR7324683.1 lysophospholipase L1-like esterase [Catenuloplanes niger]
MSRLRSIGAAVTAAALMLTVAAQPAHATSATAAAPGIRLMPLGDSITYGWGGAGGNGYRSHLYQAVAAAGGTVDFVGTQRDGDGADPDHEGHSGWVIDQIAAIAPGVVAQYQPNVVALHIGTNDMNNNVDPAGAPRRLDALLDRIYAEAPSATILLALIIPASNPVVQQRIDTYNAAVASIAERRRAAGQRIVPADMRGVTTADLPDGLHPNDAGYRTMATAFHAALTVARNAGMLVEPGGGSCHDSAGWWIERPRFAAGVGAARANIRFADVTGDGRADYLVLNARGGFDAWINAGGDASGNPGWTLHAGFAAGTGAAPATVHLADISGDRRADYLVVNATTGAVDAWINNGGDRPGQAGWTARGRIATGAGAPGAHIRFADLDGDRRADYLVLNPTTGAVDAWLNRGGDGQGGWTARPTIAGGTGTGNVRFANLDCDVRADYLVVDPATGAVDAWLNRGGDRDGVPGWAHRGRIAGGAGSADSVVLADVSGDGRDDYLVVAPNGAVDAWINNGGDPA